MWFVCTRSGVILFKMPSKKQAIEAAFARLKVGQYASLFVMNEEIYITKNRDKVIKITRKRIEDREYELKKENYLYELLQTK